VGSLFDQLYNQTAGRVFKKGSRGDTLLQGGADLADRLPDPTDIPGAFADAAMGGGQAVGDALTSGLKYLQAAPGEDAAVPPFRNISAAAHAKGPVTEQNVPSLFRPEPPAAAPAPAPESLLAQAAAPQRASVGDAEFAGLRAGEFKGGGGFTADGSIRDFVMNDQARQLLGQSIEGDSLLAKAREGAMGPKGLDADVESRKKLLLLERMMPAGSESGMQYRDPSRGAREWTNADQMNDFDKDGRGELGARTIGEAQALGDSQRASLFDMLAKERVATASTREKVGTVSDIDREASAKLREIEASNDPPEKKARDRETVLTRRAALLRSLGAHVSPEDIALPEDLPPARG
jgi:hypothetical protein